VGIIDWCVNATAKAFGIFSSVFRRVQTGVTESYIFVFVLGVIAIIGVLLWK
jgi:hypothetical protein